MNSIKVLAILALVVSQAAPAANNLKQFSIAMYHGTDRNWFNPANWSTGRVPGENDAVVLDGNDDVVVDPSQANGRVPGKVNINAIWMTDSARLETLPGTHFVAKLQVTDGRASFFTRSSIVETGAAVTLDGLNGANPSGWYRKQPWVALGGTMYFGLGGREPAGLTKVGAGTLALTGYGYYANVVGGTIALGGSNATSARFEAVGRITDIREVNASSFHRLFGDISGDSTASTSTRNFLSRPANLPPPAATDARIDRLPKLLLALHYDFKPAVGDTFQIITADSLVGQFADLPEGALVGCTEDDSVGLWITYRGGDGNDVVLDTRPGDAEICQTKEHILLARQVGVPSL